MKEDLLGHLLRTLLAQRSVGMALILGSMAAIAANGLRDDDVVEALAAECGLALNRLALDGVASVVVPLADQTTIMVGFCTTAEAVIIDCRPLPVQANPASVARWCESFPTPIRAQRVPVLAQAGARCLA